MPGHQPELRQLESFVVAAQELHFTRAAQRLFVTQQALSSQIRQLERLLEVQLFQRTTRHVELTEPGRVLLEHAVPLLAVAGRTWEAVGQAAAGDTGHVAMSYAPTMRRQMLPLLLAEFQRRHPGVEVRSREVVNDDTSLTDGITDVIVSRSRPPTGKNVASIPILYTPLGLVIGHGHEQAGRDGIDLTQLDGEPMMIWPREFSRDFYDTIVAALRGGGFAGPVQAWEFFGSRFLMENPATCGEIAASRALSFGFEHQYTELEPEIVWRPIQPTLPIPMHLSWRRDRSAAVRNLVAIALEVANAQQWLPDERRAEAERLLAA